MEEANFSTPDVITSGPPPGRVMGPKFDDDSDEDTYIGDELVKFAAQFAHPFTVLHSPARCGIFLNYLFIQNRDVSPTLFYFASHYFQHVTLCFKDLAKDHRRMAMEIYTTFLHEKSPLRVNLPAEVLQATLESIHSSASAMTFIAAANAALDLMKAQFSKLEQDIRHGMDTWKPSAPISLTSYSSREDELTAFELYLTGRLLQCQQLSTDSETGGGTQHGTTTGILGYEQALSVALVTAHRYLSIGQRCQPKPSVDSSNGKLPVSSSGGGFFRSTFTRSFENLTAIGVSTNNISSSHSGSIGGGLHVSVSSLWHKLPSFASKPKHKTSFFTNRKAKHSLKGHILLERFFDFPTDCSLCGNLLWGLAPQGYICKECDMSVHLKCKHNIRTYCPRDGRKSGTNGGGGAAPLDSSLLIQRPVIANDLTQSAGDATASAAVIGNGASLSEGLTDQSSLSETQQISETQKTEAESRKVSGSHRVGAGDTIEGAPESRQHMRGKTPYDSMDLEKILPSRRCRDSLVSTLSTTTANSRYTVSDELRRQNTETLSGGGGTAAENLPELVTTDWSDDPEMMVGETFDPDVELARNFPDYITPAKGVKNEEYIRILCLMEFHQKIRYILRHLKQYNYLLIQRWPKEHYNLMDSLSLDRVPVLIELFRGLVACIDATRQSQSYAGMAEAIFVWLTGDESANLNFWAQHCQALSCTNMLTSVRLHLQNYARRNPELLPLLQTRYNKFDLIDGLSQTRILYLNLPMIVQKIIKDLQKKTHSYKNEAKLWQEIYDKLASLPHGIDDVCMPLVHQVNNGQIPSLDRKDWLLQRQQDPFYKILVDFPRNLFRLWVKAHVRVVVDKLNTTWNRLVIDYIRERTEMQMIVVHNTMIFLSRDNERFGLRAFKAIREKGGGGSGPVAAGLAGPQLSSASLTASAAGTTTAGGTPGGGSGANPTACAESPEQQRQAPANKLVPIFSMKNVFASRGEERCGEYLLNIVFMNPTLLFRVIFPTEKQRKEWCDLLRRPLTASAQQSEKIASGGGDLEQDAAGAKVEEENGQEEEEQESAEEKLLGELTPSVERRDSILSSETSSLFDLPGGEAGTISRRGPPNRQSDDKTSSSDLSLMANQLAAIIGEYNNVQDRFKSSLIASYGLSPRDIQRIQQGTWSVDNGEKKKNLIGLLLSGLEFNADWTKLLMGIVSQVTYPQGVPGDDAEVPSGDPTESTLWTGPEPNFSSSRTVKEQVVGRRTSSSDALSLATSSTLKRRQHLKLTRAESSRSNRQEAGVRIEDHRRSHRRLCSNTTDTFYPPLPVGGHPVTSGEQTDRPLPAPVDLLLLPKLSRVFDQFTRLARETIGKGYDLSWVSQGPQTATSSTSSASVTSLVSSTSGATEQPAAGEREVEPPIEQGRDEEAVEQFSTVSNSTSELHPQAPEVAKHPQSQQQTTLCPTTLTASAEPAAPTAVQLDQATQTRPGSADSFHGSIIVEQTASYSTGLVWADGDPEPACDGDQWEEDCENPSDEQYRLAAEQLVAQVLDKSLRSCLPDQSICPDQRYTGCDDPTRESMTEPVVIASTDRDAPGSRESLAEAEPALL